MKKILLLFILLIFLSKSSPAYAQIINPTPTLFFVCIGGSQDVATCDTQQTPGSNTVSIAPNTIVFPIGPQAGQQQPVASNPAGQQPPANQQPPTTASKGATPNTNVQKCAAIKGTYNTQNSKCVCNNGTHQDKVNNPTKNDVNNFSPCLSDAKICKLAKGNFNAKADMCTCNPPLVHQSVNNQTIVVGFAMCIKPKTTTTTTPTTTKPTAPTTKKHMKPAGGGLSGAVCKITNTCKPAPKVLKKCPNNIIAYTCPKPAAPKVLKKCPNNIIAYTCPKPAAPKVLKKCPGGIIAYTCPAPKPVVKTCGGGNGTVHGTTCVCNPGFNSQPPLCVPNKVKGSVCAPGTKLNPITHKCA